MLTMRDMGVDTFVDVGPSDTLHKLMRRIDKSATRISFDPENPASPFDSPE